MSVLRAVHALVLLSLVALAAGIAEWTQYSALGLAAAAALLLPLRGLVRGNAYTARWASMLVVIYCSFLLAEAYAQPQHKVWPLALSVLAVLNFLSLALYIRMRTRGPSASPAPAAGSGGVSR